MGKSISSDVGEEKNILVECCISNKNQVQVRSGTIPSYPPSENTYVSVEEYGFVTCVLGGV